MKYYRVCCANLFWTMTSPYYTRSEARRPKFYISESDKGEPNDVPPSATYISSNRPPFTSQFVTPHDKTTGKTEYLSTEPTGFVLVPATHCRGHIIIRGRAWFHRTCRLPLYGGLPEVPRQSNRSDTDRVADQWPEDRRPTWVGRRK